MNEATIERVAKHLASSNGDPAAWGAYAHQAMQVIELAEDQWEPIETAPKGVHIYVCGGRTDEYNYDRGAATPHAPEVWWDERYDGDWRFCSYDSGHYGIYESPTHWRPLPNPSKT